MEVTRRVAEFVAGTTFDRIPPNAIEGSKKAFLDTLGVTIAGSAEPAGKIIRDFVEEMGGKPVAGVICGGFRTSTPMAALANGTMAHALDYDDSAGIQMPLHPSVPVMPATLAAGEQAKASGKDIVLAYILGVEIEAKFASAMNISHYARGWHPTATFGTLGATAAAAKLMQLNVEQTMSAFGIACSLAGGLRQNFGTMTKPLHAGNAARNGVLAASLAKRGWSADANIFESPCGFVRLFSGDGDSALEQIVLSLGNPFHLVRPGIAIKNYPSCFGTHAPMDAMKELMKQQEVRVEDIESVECGNPSLVIEGLVRPDVHTGVEGKFSIEHCLASMLLDKRVGLRHFTNERVGDPGLAKLRHKVHVFADPELWDGKQTLDYFASAVTVKLKDGSKYSYRYKAMKSDLAAQRPWEDVTAKFTECAQVALPKRRASALVKRVQDLEHLKDVTTLVNLTLG